MDGKIPTDNKVMIFKTEITTKNKELRKSDYRNQPKLNRSKTAYINILDNFVNYQV